MTVLTLQPPVETQTSELMLVLAAPAGGALQLLPARLRGDGPEEGGGGRAAGAVPAVQPHQRRRTVGHAGQPHRSALVF